MRGRVFMVLLTVGGLAQADVPCWRVAPEDSGLTFRAVQAGAEFTGEFRDFTADICFAPEDLANSYLHVTVNPASVATQNSDRDAALLSPDFFFVAKFPQAEFATQAFRALDDGAFAATGTLSLRGVKQNENITFHFANRDNGTAVLEGEATLQRLDYGIGQGDWQDTQWVGNDVHVVFYLTLVPAQ